MATLGKDRHGPSVCLQNQFSQDISYHYGKIEWQQLPSWLSKEVGHLVSKYPDFESKEHHSWVASDYCVTIRLLNSMEEQVIVGVIFLVYCKGIGETSKHTYSVNNISMVGEL